MDNPLVIPAGQKIRFLLTAQDVIHAWWVPDFGMKKDAIPGYVNEIWVQVEADKVGTYRGQCAELCGRDHGFMPIVVEVKSPADFDAWLRAKQAEQKLADGARRTAPGAPSPPPRPRRGHPSSKFQTRSQTWHTNTPQTTHAHDDSRSRRTTTVRPTAGAAGSTRRITRTSARCTWSSPA